MQPDDTNWTVLAQQRGEGDAPYTATESVPTDSDNGFMVRVEATHDPDGETGDAAHETYLSAPVPVGAINVAPSNVEADRDIDAEPDQRSK